MPNHISNRVSILNDEGDESEDEIEQIKALMKTADSPFDFNVLFPYPDRFASLDDARRKADALGIPYSERAADGFNSGGYEWCSEHWGTKWNAYSIGFDYGAILFQTAWATPKPIWAELSKRFPAFRLVVEYADEDRGRNCGKFIYMAGDVLLEKNEEMLCDPKLFARAIIAEHNAADNWAEVLKLREQIESLKSTDAGRAALAEYEATHERR